MAEIVSVANQTLRGIVPHHIYLVSIAQVRQNCQIQTGRSPHSSQKKHSKAVGTEKGIDFSIPLKIHLMAPLSTAPNGCRARWNWRLNESHEAYSSSASSSSLYVRSLIMYLGRCLVSIYILPIYSPITPMQIS